ncbi:NADPH-dependent F420 reductase [Paenirhodobacter populi]|uniref:NADPH-dependent F420 reductase n=1 Tax=Paenirhodobacter populi TaxID=2306993 RepID=A0A443JR62_9RHOB|nr:NADPH-dependent F420 reductase [Sinirhodobacter populi]RWR23000.1 NADPH-dependent F420 reductase [Sinirhodobacter populi]
MKIAVIGTGNMGSGFARALVAAGKEVIIGHRDPAKAAALAADIGSNVEGGGIPVALKVSDIAIFALPYDATIAHLKEAGDLTGKILVDISNPIAPDYKDLVLGLTTSAAEEIQKAAPTATVVKAFNTIFAGLLAQEARPGKTLQVFVAGDEPSATGKVRDLAAALGFAPTDAGPLTNSRFLEPIGEMNIQFGYFLGRGTGIAPAWVSVAD